MHALQAELAGESRPEKRFSPAARVRIVLQEIFWLFYRVIYGQSSKSAAQRALASCKTLASGTARLRLARLATYLCCWLVPYRF